MKCEILFIVSINFEINRQFYFLNLNNFNNDAVGSKNMNRCFQIIISLNMNKVAKRPCRGVSLTCEYTHIPRYPHNHKDSESNALILSFSVSFPHWIMFNPLP